MPPLCGRSTKRERPLAFEEESKEMSVVVPKTRGKGRPPKADLIAVKERNKGKIGRPVGDAGRIQEFKERLLATGGTRIIDKVVSIAMNDDHQGQMAAIKLCMDRLLPMSVFEAAKQGGNVPQISINISSMAAPVVETVEDITDV